MKGFFNAIELFRWGRGADSWRLLPARELAEKLELNNAPTTVTQTDYPLDTLSQMNFECMLRLGQAV